MTTNQVSSGPEYAVVAVCYSTKPRRIIAVKVRPVVAATMNGPPRVTSDEHERVVTKDAVLRRIDVGERFFTTIMEGVAQGVARRIAEVRPVPKNGRERFLRTIEDGIEEDNLGELPEFDCSAEIAEELPPIPS